MPWKSFWLGSVVCWWWFCWVAVGQPNIKTIEIVHKYGWPINIESLMRQYGNQVLPTSYSDELANHFVANGLRYLATRVPWKESGASSWIDHDVTKDPRSQAIIAQIDDVVPRRTGYSWRFVPLVEGFKLEDGSPNLHRITWTISNGVPLVLRSPDLLRFDYYTLRHGRSVLLPTAIIRPVIWTRSGNFGGAIRFHPIYKFKSSAPNYWTFPSPAGFRAYLASVQPTWLSQLDWQQHGYELAQRWNTIDPNHLFITFDTPDAQLAWKRLRNSDNSLLDPTIALHVQSLLQTTHHFPPPTILESASWNPNLPPHLGAPTSSPSSASRGAPLHEYDFFPQYPGSRPHQDPSFRDQAGSSSSQGSHDDLDTSLRLG